MDIISLETERAAKKSVTVTQVGDDSGLDSSNGMTKETDRSKRYLGSKIWWQDKRQREVRSPGETQISTMSKCVMVVPLLS